MVEPAIARVGELPLLWPEASLDRAAVVAGDAAWTYRQLRTAVADAARWLAARGVRPGDRLMIVSENSAAAVALVLAAAVLDAWAVPVSGRLSDREVDDIRSHSGPRRSVYALAGSARTRAHAERHGAGRDEGAPLEGIALGALDEHAQPEPVKPDPADRVAAVIYTSGTTGRPKGVMLTNRGMLYVARATAEARGIGLEDRVYATLPVSHALGLVGGVLGPLLKGATVLLPPRFDPVAAFAAVREGVTMLFGTPAMFALLAEHAERKGISDPERPRLRLLSVAGAPLDPALKERTERIFGLPLSNGYGATECSPSITVTPLGECRGDVSVGRLLPGIEARLLSPDGSPAPPGEPGELHVRTPGVMRGYYNAPEETAAVLDPAGWFNTRDLARLEDGILTIVGRSRELIIRFGFNVHPPEVEAVLNAHPKVRQSAVIGRPATGTEEILAFVQPAEGETLDRAELADFAAARLAPYKRPNEIHVVDHLPAGPTGKILKAELPALAARLAAR